MLHRFVVERFKSIVELDIELGRINVFIGANGSGKSNILEAIGVLGAAAFGRVDDESLLRRGVRPGVPQLYKTAFPDLGKNVPHISFEAVGRDGASFKVALGNPLKDPNPAWQFKSENFRGPNDDLICARSPATRKTPNVEQGLAALEAARLKPGDPAWLLMDDLRNFAIYCPNTPTLRGLVPDPQTREPLGLAGGRLSEAIEEVLTGARRDPFMKDLLGEVEDLIEWAESVAAVPSVGVPLSPSAARTRLVIAFADRFMARKRNRLTAYDASEGALYVLFAAILALHPKAPRCFAVDNLDQALNPRLAMRLMQTLCSMTERRGSGSQWLVTAHNPAVLDGLSLDRPDIRLFAVDRNSWGHTTVRRIDLEAALKARPDAGWTLSRMWMNGLLGAVPDV